MNATKGLFFIAAITLGWVSACNYTVGECWPRGEGGWSGGEAISAAGGGVILPTGPSGAGGFGDEPPKQPQDARDPHPLECNETEEQSDKEQPDKNDISPEDDGSYEAGLKVFCLKRDHGVICSERCLAQGVGCVPLALHPYKKADGGIGKLYACNTLLLGFMCSYAYPNGDSCNYVFGNPFPNTCTYTGKD